MESVAKGSDLYSIDDLLHSRISSATSESSAFKCRVHAELDGISLFADTEAIDVLLHLPTTDDSSNSSGKIEAEEPDNEDTFPVIWDRIHFSGGISEASIYLGGVLSPQGSTRAAQDFDFLMIEMKFNLSPFGRIN